VAVEVFFDTSVLLAGLIDFGPRSAPAQSILHAVAEKKIPGAVTGWHCCLEFYSVSTRLPPEFRLDPADAARRLGRIYDAHIAEVACAAGARVIVTDNRRHFLSALRHGIRVETPTEFLHATRKGDTRPD
jgi:predicted nucleic acid-binding protein